jgi:hypothetical protein
MTAAKIKPLIFSVLGFALSNVANIDKTYISSASRSHIVCQWSASCLDTVSGSIPSVGWFLEFCLE